MLTGRRYLLAYTPEQEAYAERVAGVCRAVWNIGLEQRREYRWRGAWINHVEQARQLAEAKADEPWLSEAPSHCLQQTLRDLERACRAHGTFKVRWRSARRWSPSLRFPEGRRILVERLNRRWGQARLPKFGMVRFRWTRALGGEIRNAIVLRDAGRWYVSFCVEDGLVEALANGKPPVGVDRRNVRQKAGLNRVILAKGWGGLLVHLEHEARYNGSEIVRVNPAYTSQTCNACGHQANADVNAALNILAAGLAATGRGDLANRRSLKRQPPVAA